MQDYAKAFTYTSALNNTIGKCLSWLSGIMAIVVLGIVLLRTFFSTGSIAAQESVTYMHAALFLLCLPFTGESDGHVRVDIFYRNWSPLAKSWVNFIGSIIFLLPFSVFITVISWPFAMASWSIGEGSIDPGGIPAVFLLKTLIPLSGALLIIFSMTEIVNNWINISFIRKTDSD